MDRIGEMSIWQYLDQVDRNVTLSLNALHCPTGDFLWVWFSNREIWFVLYAVVLYMFFRRLGWRKALVVVLSVALTVVVCDQLANFVKETVARLRPCADEGMLSRGLRILEGGGGYGFFSGHAANAMGFAVSSTAGFRNDRSRRHVVYAILITVWALLVGISRVFVGKHFFGDVITGFVVGAVVGWAMSALSNFFIRKYFND